MGWSALHFACCHGNYRIVSLLIYKGANIDLTTKQGLNSLMIVSLKGFKEIAEILIYAGIDINATDVLSNTALHFACKENKKSVVELLLSRPSINIAIENKEKKPPFELTSNKEILGLFKEHFMKKKKGQIQNKRIIIHNTPTKTSKVFYLKINFKSSNSNSSLKKESNLASEDNEKKNIYKDVDKMNSNENVVDSIKVIANEEIKNVIPNDFHVHGLLGRGSFGDVFLVEHKKTKEIYAMKTLSKEKIHKFAPGGDLGEHLEKEKRFSEERTKIYIAEIILALEDLHSKDIIYRDLKPENIVLDIKGHAMLTDFGLSKEGVYEPSVGARSFCGSVAYLAPEMLKRCGHGKAVDWYLLGVVMYEMLVGIPPYYANDRDQLFHNIENAILKFPPTMTADAKSLLKSLLQRNPMKRLGSGKGDSEEIKNHQFFKGINWNEVIEK